MKTNTDPDDLGPVEIPISDLAREGYLPDHVSRFRDLVARLRASDRSAMILVDGKRGTIQVFNTVPAGVFRIS